MFRIEVAEPDKSGHHAWTLVLVVGDRDYFIIGSAADTFYRSPKEAEAAAGNTVASMLADAMRAGTRIR